MAVAVLVAVPVAVAVAVAVGIPPFCMSQFANASLRTRPVARFRAGTQTNTTPKTRPEDDYVKRMEEEQGMEGLSRDELRRSEAK